MAEVLHGSSLAMEEGMGDQAAGLRRMFGRRAPQVVAFTAARGGCGRTTLVVQTAVALASTGQRVLIVDENQAANNALSCFGLKPRGDLFQVLRGEQALEQAVLSINPSLRILPAARAARELEHADRSAAAAWGKLGPCLRGLQREVDFILLDTAVRRGGHLSPLALAARHMAIIVAAQSTAITQAYAMIKKIAQERGREGFQVAITHPRTLKEGQAIFDNMQRLARDQLGISLGYLGASMAPSSENLANALVRQLPPVFDESGFAGMDTRQASLTTAAGVASTTVRSLGRSGHGTGQPETMV
jgi:flagellar biosynthesis protein FlhG